MGRYLLLFALSLSISSIIDAQTIWSFREIGSGTKPSIHVDSNNEIHVTALKEDQSSGFLSYFKVNGLNVQLQNVLNGYFYGPIDIITATTINTPIIAFHHHTIGDGELSLATSLGNEDWSLDVATNEGHDGWDGTIIIDDNNALHAVSTDPSNGTEYGLFANGQWSIETIDPTPAMYQYGTDIDLDSNGNVHVTYFTDGVSTLKHATKTQDAWLIQEIDTDAVFPSMIMTANGPVIAYLKVDRQNGIWATGGEVRIATRTNDMWTSTAVESLPDVATGVFSGARAVVDLQLSEDGTWHIAFANNKIVRYGTYDGSNWSIQTILDVNNESYNSLGQQVSLDLEDDGSAHIVTFRRETGNDGRVIYGNNKNVVQPFSLVCPEDIVITCNESITPDRTGEPDISGDLTSFTFIDTMLQECPADIVIQRSWIGLVDNIPRDTCIQLITVTVDTLFEFTVEDTLKVDEVCISNLDEVIQLNLDLPCSVGIDSVILSTVEQNCERIILDATWIFRNECQDTSYNLVQTIVIENREVARLNETIIIADTGSASGSITLLPSCPFDQLSYEWSNGATDSLITGLSGGTYQVVITDEEGCIDSITYEVLGSMMDTMMMDTMMMDTMMMDTMMMDTMMMDTMMMDTMMMDTMMMDTMMMDTMMMDTMMMDTMMMDTMMMDTMMMDTMMMDTMMMDTMMMDTMMMDTMMMDTMMMDTMMMDTMMMDTMMMDTMMMDTMMMDTMMMDTMMMDTMMMDTMMMDTMMMDTMMMDTMMMDTMMMDTMMMDTMMMDTMMMDTMMMDTMMMDTMMMDTMMMDTMMMDTMMMDTMMMDTMMMDTMMMDTMMMDTMMMDTMMMDTMMMDTMMMDTMMMDTMMMDTMMMDTMMMDTMMMDTMMMDTMMMDTMMMDTMMMDTMMMDTMMMDTMMMDTMMMDTMMMDTMMMDTMMMDTMMMDTMMMDTMMMDTMMMDTMMMDTMMMDTMMMDTMMMDTMMMDTMMMDTMMMDTMMMDTMMMDTMMMDTMMMDTMMMDTMMMDTMMMDTMMMDTMMMDTMMMDTMMMDTMMMDTMMMDTVIKTTLSLNISNREGTSLSVDSIYFMNRDSTFSQAIVDSTGSYAPEGGLSNIAGICMTKGGAEIEGLSSLDLVRGQRIVLRFTQGCPEDQLALDVSGDGKTTAFDLALMKSILLGRIDDYPGGKVWEFVKTDDGFTPQANQGACILLNDEDRIRGSLNVVGIKLGDLMCPVDDE